MAKAKKSKPKDPLRVARGKLGRVLRELAAHMSEREHLLREWQGFKVEYLQRTHDRDYWKQSADFKALYADAAVREMLHWKDRATAAEVENVRLRIEAAAELRCGFDLGSKPSFTRIFLFRPYGLVPSGLLSIEHYQIS